MPGLVDLVQVGAKSDAHWLWDEPLPEVKVYFLQLIVPHLQKDALGYVMLE
jgi:hypothetical protein